MNQENQEDHLNLNHHIEQTEPEITETNVFTESMFEPGIKESHLNENLESQSARDLQATLEQNRKEMEHLNAGYLENSYEESVYNEDDRIEQVHAELFQMKEHQNEDQTNNSIDHNKSSMNQRQMNTKLSETEPKVRQQAKKKNRKNYYNNQVKEKVVSSIKIVKIVPNNSTHDSLLDQFKKHLPKWGARIEYQGEKDVFLSNTCSLDYFLLALWYISQSNFGLFQKIPENTVLIGDTDVKYVIDELVSLIHETKWDKAREIWVKKIMQLNMPAKRKTISIFGSVDEIVRRYVSGFQKYFYVQKCNENCQFNNHVRSDLGEMDIIFYSQHNDRFIFTSSDCQFRSCSYCNTIVSVENGFHFNHTPIFFLAEPLLMLNVNQIPKEAFIINNKYILLFAALLSDTRHFTAIFNIKGDLFLVNDLKKVIQPYYLTENNPDFPVYCMYCLDQ